MIGQLLGNILALYLEAAPWLLFGLFSAGLIKTWIPDATMYRWLGGSGAGPVLKAALVGAPLPLCSCGVLPAALGLRRAGASRGATVSFLIATPETGVDSIAISYAMMGPLMAVARPLAAIVSAVCSGLLVGLVPGQTNSTSAPANGCGCRCSCSGEAPKPSRSASVGQGLHYAFSDVLDDITLWLLAGLLVAGAIATWLPPQALAQWGGGPAAMLVMLAVGIPMYICATASTPLATALLLAGVSPGTVLVFLLAGPATNLATLAVVRKEMGTGVLTAYLVGISVSALALGLLTDAIVHHWGIDIATQLAHSTEWLPAPIAWVSGAVLAVLAIAPLRDRLWPQ